MSLTVAAFKRVSALTIANCWLKAKIFRPVFTTNSLLCGIKSSDQSVIISLFDSAAHLQPRGSNEHVIFARRLDI
eukprot:m.817984 g.817984  ORF g.817984 m.817984 type:complete len:75 (+) comp59388_c0_seq62:106-330(+)